MTNRNAALINARLSNALAAQVGIDVAPLLEFEGQPLRHFYHRAACGGGILRLGGTLGTTRTAEVPMAFQSALAGVPLAAEVVLDATELRESAGVHMLMRTEIDLLRPLGTHLSSPALKHPSGQCLCQDEDYVRAHTEKYVAVVNERVI